MPCSCGNTNCPCGIPCYCSEESCKCHACAMALHRFCRICNKPLTADIQIDESKCSCFASESIALILENGDNPRYRMGNLPMHSPDDFSVNGQLVFNVRIPVSDFSQHIDQRHFDCIPPPPIQADSRKIFPIIFGDNVVTPIHSDVESGNHSTTELQPFESESSEKYAASSISSTGKQKKKVSFKEFPKLALECSEERTTANTEHNTKSERELSSNDQELCFYLPSFKFGNISYPVRLEDPVWSLPNFVFSIAYDPNSSLKICNPFHMPGLVGNIQSDKENQQLACGSNFNANNLLKAEPFFGAQECSGAEQPLHFVPFLASGCNDSLPYFGDSSIANRDSGNMLPQTIEEWQNIIRASDQIPEFAPTTLGTEVYLKDLNVMEPLNRGLRSYALFDKKPGASTSEENEYQNGANNGFTFENKENDPIPLYIDTCTTQKIGKLLKPKPTNLRARPPTFADPLL